MEIILLKDVLNCGFKDDLVTVKDGYATNYLIPQGFAVLATEASKKVLNENLKQRQHKEDELIKKADSEKIAIYNDRYRFIRNSKPPVQLRRALFYPENRIGLIYFCLLTSSKNYLTKILEK